MVKENLYILLVNNKNIKILHVIVQFKFIKKYKNNMIKLYIIITGLKQRNKNIICIVYSN